MHLFQVKENTRGTEHMNISNFVLYKDFLLVWKLRNNLIDEIL